MRVLELFSGAGSVGDVCKRLGCEVVSLDRDMEADIRTDIMEWDYRSYPTGSFDVIWSSPPCTEHSRAKTIGVRKLDEANGIVKRTLEITDYFNPTYWIMENPQTGLLKSQPFIAELPYNDLDYCKHGMAYRKRTRLWNNIEAWTPRPLRKKATCLATSTSSVLSEARHSIWRPSGGGGLHGICTGCLRL